MGIRHYRLLSTKFNDTRRALVFAKSGQNQRGRRVQSARQRQGEVLVGWLGMGRGRELAKFSIDTGREGGRGEGGGVRDEAPPPFNLTTDRLK